MADGAKSPEKPATIDEIRNWLEDDGLIGFLNIAVTDWDPDASVLTLTMPMRSELQGGAGPGHMHGGAIGALIDTAATFVFLASGVQQCPTANYRVDMFRPVVGSPLIAIAKIVRRGRTLGVSDVEAFDKNKKLVAVGRATFSILS